MVFGWVGAFFSVVMMAAQVLRIRRYGPPGVSPSAWSIFFVVHIFWVVYAAMIVSVPLLVSSPISGFVILLILLQLRGEWDKAMYLSSAGCFLVFVVATLLGTEALALAIAVGAVVLRFPQIYRLVVTRSTEGVSISTWIIAAVMNTMWMAYALDERYNELALANAAILSSSLTVLLLAVYRRIRNPALPV